MNNEAMVKALNTFRILKQYTWPHNAPPLTDCEFVHYRFLAGQCAMTIKWVSVVWYSVA